MIIIPAVLTNNPEELKEKLLLCEDKVERVQIDINDGEFLENKTVMPDILIGFETPLFLDFHLMVKEPFSWVEKCAQVGAERIIGQVEAMTSQMDFVVKVQEAGLKVGLALDIKTPVETLDRTVLNDLDLVLLMGYPAGKSGQAFDRSVLKKVGELVELRKKDITPFRIAVDGGVNEENIRELAGLGVDEVVIGRRLFVKGEIQENLETLKEKLL